MYIGKLFDKYKVNFPVKDELKIIVGLNGTGKTQTLLLLKKYFEKKGENVIYFPDFRISNLTMDDVEGFEVMHALTQGYNFFDRYGLKTNMLEMDLKWAYGEYINSGFIQILNFFCNISKAGPEAIVLIDTPETSLHIAIKRHFIDDILNLDNVKKLIVVTHDPEILSSHYTEGIEIENCVKLGS